MSLSLIVGEEEECLLLMDNAPYHMNVHTIYDNHHIIYILPYTCDTIHMKIIFFVLKSHMKRMLSSNVDNNPTTCNYSAYLQQRSMQCFKMKIQMICH